MDDLLLSVSAADDAKERRKQITELGELAEFHICKWVSNKPDVIADVVDEEGFQDKLRKGKIASIQDPRCPVDCYGWQIFLCALQLDPNSPWRMF